MERRAGPHHIASVLPPAAPLPAVAAFSLRGEPLTLTAGVGFAGAISSLRYRGREHLDASDHGRLLQTAVSFGGAGECDNPTLAGAGRDPPGASTSRLMEVAAGRGVYRSSTRAAYWRGPGQLCRTAPAPAWVPPGPALSDVTIAQTLAPGAAGRGDLLRMTVTVSSARPHPPATVEALTGYMPPGFSALYALDAGGDRFERRPLPDGPIPPIFGPVVLSREDGAAAMGALSLDPGADAYASGRNYGPVVKWSVVYRPTGAWRPGPHVYRLAWTVGTRAEVEAAVGDAWRRVNARARAHTLRRAGEAGAGALALLALVGVWRRRSWGGPPTPLGPAPRPGPR